MMTDDRNQDLQDLFSETGHELIDDVFTSQVLSQTNRRRNRVFAVVAGVAVVLMAIVWIFSAPLQEFAMLVGQGLATPLVELGDNRLAWVFTPVNNIASLLVLLVKIIRMAWKKLGRASFVF